MSSSSQQQPQSLNDLFLNVSQQDLQLLDNQQLAHVAQLAFREDSIHPAIRLKVYEFILNDGHMMRMMQQQMNDDDKETTKNKFTLVYTKYKNSVRGLNDEISASVEKIFEETEEQKTMAEKYLLSSSSVEDDDQQQSSSLITDELCGICEYLASRLELTGASAAGFIVTTVQVMFSAVIMELHHHHQNQDKNSNNNSKSLQNNWPSIVFNLSFQFAQKHKYTLSLSDSAAQQQQIVLTTSTTSPTKGGTAATKGNTTNRKEVALILLRLILQYHLPSLMRHCDQYQISLCDWVLDKWLLPQLKDVFFPTSTTKRSLSHTLCYFDFIIAARDPLIMFGLAVEILASNQKKLLALDKKDKFKEGFDSIDVSLFYYTKKQNDESNTNSSSEKEESSSSVVTIELSKESSHRSTMLRAQQLLRSTPRCAKNRLRHYFHGTKLMYPLPDNNNNEQANNNNASSSPANNNQKPSAESTADSSNANNNNTNHNVLYDERDLYQSQVVLPVSNSELVEAFAMSTDDTDSSIINSTKKVTNKNDSDFDHHLRPLSFVILDCRSEKSFHFARLPTAIHIGADVGFDPDLMQSMIERFEGARGSHMCVLGTGRGVQEEANLLKIIALRFVQAGFPYVSIAEDGFKGLIPAIKGGRVEVVKSQMPQLKQFSSPPQQGQQQQKQPSSSSTTEKKSLTSDEILRKAEETAKEAKEAASKWGKSIMSKFSGWSLGGNKNEKDQQQSQEKQTEKSSKPTNTGDNNNTSSQSNTTNVGNDRTEIIQEDNHNENNNNNEGTSQTTFKVGGNDDQEDEDDDELLSELVTTVAEPQKVSTQPQEQKTTEETTPSTNKQNNKDGEGAATGSEASPHPFDELFGDDDE